MTLESQAKPALAAGRAGLALTGAAAAQRWARAGGATSDPRPNKPQ